MKATDFKKHPMTKTLIIMALSASIGIIIAILVALPAIISTVALMGPVAWLTIGPILIAAVSSSIMWALIGAPVWAIAGGFWFAGRMSGNGSAAKQHGVSFLSSSHPISIRTNELSTKLGLPNIPYIGWYEKNDINAFAMGTKFENTLIAFSRGAVENLTRKQFDAVIGHELAHVANNDMYRMTFLRGAQEALTFFLIFRSAKKIARWIFTPLSEIYIMKFSRDREFEADNIGAQLTSSRDMAAALTAIQNQQNKQKPHDAYQNIRISSWNTQGLFRTHPPLNMRIRNL